MNSPTTKQVMAFLEVCRDFHYSRAAARLGMQQPQLSRLMRELEELVGAKLFERSGRGARWTVAGTVFLREVDQVPALLSRAVEGARRAAAGEESLLRIGFVGALMSDGLLGVLERFRAESPATQLSLLDLAPAALAAMVESGEIDGAFLGVRPTALAPGVACLKWREEAVFVCVPKGHALAERRRLAVGDLAGLPVVALAWSLAPSYREFLERLYEEGGLRLESVRETNGVEAMLSMVVAGCGVALLPGSALRTASDRVVAVPLGARAARLQEVFLYAEAAGPELARFVGLLRAVAAG